MALLRQFPEGLPWLTRVDSVETLERWYAGDDGWHGPQPEEWMSECETDVYISLERGVELTVSRHDDSLDREEHDTPRYSLWMGSNSDRGKGFSSENWEFVLDKMAEWGLLG